MASMHCPGCQAEIPDGAFACPKCGFAIAERRGQAEPPVWPDPMTRQPPKDFAGSAFAGCLGILIGGALGLLLGIAAAYVNYKDPEPAGFGIAPFVFLPPIGAIIGAVAGLRNCAA